MSGNDNNINLHELLKKRSYEHGLITTFTFNAWFFEEYALERFKSLQSCSNLTIFLDQGEYEEVVQATTSTKDWAPRLANLRYLLHPIRVPGVFHPKVFLFANAKSGLLVIGSANFSQDGLGSNAELVSVFEFELGKNETTLPLFQQAMQFFEDLLELWPSKEAASNLGDLQRGVPWITAPSQASGDDLPLLLSNLKEPLWDQLLKKMPTKVDRFSLVSRFFDSSPKMLDAVAGPLGSATIDIYTQAVIHTMGQAWFDHPLRKSKRLKIHLCRYADGEHSQQLHGKAYAFRCGKRTVLACGSANFSTSALLRPASSGNVEVLLVYPAGAVGNMKPEELFDPLNSAMELKNQNQLMPPGQEATEPVSRAQSFSIQLREVTLDEGELLMDADAVPAGVECRIQQSNKRPVTVAIGSVRNGQYRIKLAPTLARQLADAPSVVQLGKRTGEDWKAISNALLVTAQMGPETGRGSRQGRRIKEAIESPQRFMGVLRELCESDDESRLKNFLTHCDIPFAANLKNFSGLKRTKSGTLAPPTDFKDLGTRNLRHFDMLHDAVVGFVARHRTRLMKHAESGAAAGIPNYLHILESVLRLLHSQIERAASGLEHAPSLTMSADEWKRIRENLSDYYRELESLLRLTTREYVAKLLHAEKRKAVCDGFGMAADEIISLLNQCIQIRARINAARAEKILVKTVMGNTEKAIFFGEQLSDQKWKPYVLSLRDLANELRRQLAA